MHPFDDPLVIAGQGTVGEEILRQRPRRLDAVFVPVGGGGLIAGIGAYIKALLPEVAIIGVEPEDADCDGTRRWRPGDRVRLDDVGIFADGVAVREVGVHTFAIVQATRRRDRPRARTTRSAPPSRTSSTTRAASWSRPARWRVAGLKTYVAAARRAGRRLVAVL